MPVEMNGEQFDLHKKEYSFEPLYKQGRNIVYKNLKWENRCLFTEHQSLTDYKYAEVELNGMWINRNNGKAASAQTICFEMFGEYVRVYALCYVDIYFYKTDVKEMDKQEFITYFHKHCQDVLAQMAEGISTSLL